MIYKRL
jgi:uncharacterized spore protein YtfJ